MANVKAKPVEIIALSELKDKSGKFKYDESSEQLPMMVKAQYEILRDDIKSEEQQEPILIWRGRIVDGRNRCKALNELGIETVKVIKLPHMCSPEERMKLARRIEHTRRHETPTQIACTAVKNYEARKKAVPKVKGLKEIICKETGTSPTNFSIARWILQNKPTTFKRLFDGENVVLDDPRRPSQSLSAVKAYYIKQEKDMDYLKEQLEMEKEEALKRMDSMTDVERVDAIAYHKKQNAYKSIATLVSNLVEAQGLDYDDCLKYLSSQKMEQLI